MSARLRAMTDRELGRALVDAGAHLAVPPLPDLAPAVARAVVAAPERRGARGRTALATLRDLVRPPGASSRRRALALAVALLVLLAGAAIATGLAVRGVRLLFREEPVPTSAAPIGSRLGLGERVSLPEADAGVAFDLVVPTLGPPDEVWLSDAATGGLVTFVYAPSDRLPELGRSGVGMLLSQFAGRTDAPSIEKEILSGTEVVEVEVNGEPGYWITGQPHAVRFLDSEGREVPPGPRLAGDTLIWQRGPLTLRMEVTLPLEAALGLAESVA